MANEITINALNPTTFELQSYSTADTNLIGEVEIDTSFSSSIDYIEFVKELCNEPRLFEKTEGLK